MRKVSRLVISLAAGLASVPVAYLVLSEAVVFYELWSTRTATRAELGDDLGFGLLLILVVLPGAAITAVVTAWGAWRFLNRRGASRVST